MKLRTTILLVALVPLASAGAMLVPGRAGERWTEMQTWADAAGKRWAARDFGREPPCGEAVDGAAFDHYAEAMRLARVLGGDDHDLLRDLRLRADTVQANVADEFARRWRGPLAALARGAHSRDARPAVDWSQGLGRPMPSLLAARDLMNAATIAARRHLAAGDSQAAVTTMLEALTFAVDLEQTPLTIDVMIACAMVGIAANDMLRDEDLRQLDPAALGRLALGLERADARGRSCFDLDGEALLLASTLLRDEARGGGVAGLEEHGVQARSWRYGWSRRWAAADAVMALVEFGERMATHRDAAWSERQTLLAEVHGELDQHSNPVVRQFAITTTAVERSLRQARTRVRLLRLAVEFHRGADLPVLADPLGDGPIAVERRGETVVFRSAGGGAGAAMEWVATPR
ncbi:MAG: hypothetical protein AB7O97_04980 [Planctomycetota bacterium]